MTIKGSKLAGLQSKAEISELIKAQREKSEQKIKRFRMAKYSTELFDEIILEMMIAKRTLMEMMAELDCDDDKIIDAQARIANRRLKAGLSMNDLI